MLKLDTLNYLYQTYQFGSVSLAAESLSVSPSTISSALHKLEKEWNVQLVDRTFRGVRLTEAGKTIAMGAKDLLDKSAELEKLIDDQREQRTDAPQEDSPITLLLARAIWQTSTQLVTTAMAGEKGRIFLPDYNHGNDWCLKRVNEEPSTFLIGFLKEPLEDIVQPYENVRYQRISSAKPCIITAKDSKLIPPGTEELSVKEALKLPYARFTEGYNNNLEVFEFLESHGKVNITQNYSNIRVLFGEVALDHAVTVGASYSTLPSFGDIFQSIPLRTDMRLTLSFCYNKSSTEKDRETIRRVFSFLF